MREKNAKTRRHRRTTKNARPDSAPHSLTLRHVQYATEKLNTDGTAHSTHHHATRDTRAVPVSAHWRCTEALERSHTRGLCCVRITLSVHAPEGAGAIYTLGMEAALHAETPRRPQLEPALLVACS